MKSPNMKRIISLVTLNDDELESFIAMLAASALLIIIMTMSIF